MRNGTKAFVSIISLGVIAAGYQVGLAAEVQNGFSATAPVIDQGQNATPEVAPAVSAGATTSASSAATPAVEATSAPAKTNAAAPALPPKTSTPASTPAVAPDPAPNTSGTTKDGSAVRYQYGTVQVSVTKAAGKITSVTMLQEGATDGRQAAFPVLIDLATQANGSSFGNLSGATYTTDAFKQSLEAALAKF